MRLRIAIVALCALVCAAQHTAQAADAGAADIVNAHFKAIAAEDYAGANTYFTEAFLRAFNSDGNGLREYYTFRHQQVQPGWKILEATPLADEGRESMLV